MTPGRPGPVVVNASISLDGYIAGPHHEMDWVFDHQFLPTTALDGVEMMIASTGAIIAGRGSHDVGERSLRAETSRAFGGRWAGPESVLTHRPPSASPLDGPRYISGDIREAVSLALGAAGGRNLLGLGAEVARQCLDADLVDEILLLVLPILIGGGIRLFGRRRHEEMLFRTETVERAGEAAVLLLRRSRQPSPSEAPAADAAIRRSLSLADAAGSYPDIHALSGCHPAAGPAGFAQSAQRARPRSRAEPPAITGPRHHRGHRRAGPGRRPRPADSARPGPGLDRPSTSPPATPSG